jgi:DNA-nicking Smr family endonuclease
VDLYRPDGPPVPKFTAHSDTLLPVSEDEPDRPFDEPVEIPVDGVLDLHLFQPRDAKDVVRAYLEACREKGVLDVQIIHGKGSGALRRTVHALLATLPEVVSFRSADELSGGWGATWVRLRPP